jgi:hypothetical protein
VTTRMAPGHHAGGVHPRDSGEHGVMAGERHALTRQPVNGRRQSRTDLGRLETVEGSDQDAQSGHAATRE